jgi:hypothetical protein
MNNTNKQQISLTNLPPEMILEVAKHLRPDALGKLYGTCTHIKKLLAPDHPKAKELHLRYIFNMLDEYTRHYSVLAFDYFSENNNRFYSGKHTHLNIYTRIRFWVLDL